MAPHHGFAVIAYRLRDDAPQRTDNGVVACVEFVREEQRSDMKIFSDP